MPTRKEILQTKINTDLATGTTITAAEHRGVESAIMNAAIPTNRGWFSGLDVQGTVIGTNLNIGGDITSATVINTAIHSTISVFFATSMITANYIVKIYIESIPTNNQQISDNASILFPVFTVIDSNNVWIYIKDIQGVQNLKFHVEAVSLDY